MNGPSIILAYLAPLLIIAAGMLLTNPRRIGAAYVLLSAGLIFGVLAAGFFFLEHRSTVAVIGGLLTLGGLMLFYASNLFAPLLLRKYPERLAQNPISWPWVVFGVLLMVGGAVTVAVS